MRLTTELILTEEAQRDGGLIVRTARKEHRCDGSGSALEQHAPGCLGVVHPGDQYLECLWSAPGFQSGTHHTAVCASDFFADWLVP